MGEITKVLKVAENWIGAEEPDARYKEIIEVFESSGKKYDGQGCCEFVCSCFIKALGLTRAKALIPIINYAEAQSKMWDNKRKTKLPTIGGIVYFGFPVNHVELIVDVDKTTFTTIDGNANHRVVKRCRNIKDPNINSFILPDYKADKELLEFTWKNAVINSVVIKRYSTGELVLWFQKYLMQKGFYLDGYLDGVFGEHMEQAVKMWQRNNNLYEDGIVGKYCWTYILK